MKCCTSERKGCGFHRFPVILSLLPPDFLPYLHSTSCACFVVSPPKPRAAEQHKHGGEGVHGWSLGGFLPRERPFLHAYKVPQYWRQACAVLPMAGPYGIPLQPLQGAGENRGGREWQSGLESLGGGTVLGVLFLHHKSFQVGKHPSKPCETNSTWGRRSLSRRGELWLM